VSDSLKYFGYTPDGSLKPDPYCTLLIGVETGEGLLGVVGVGVTVPVVASGIPSLRKRFISAVLLFVSTPLLFLEEGMRAAASLYFPELRALKTFV
jgi:hypothetical protein